MSLWLRPVVSDQSRSRAELNAVKCKTRRCSHRPWLNVRYSPPEYDPERARSKNRGWWPMVSPACWCYELGAAWLLALGWLVNRVCAPLTETARCLFSELLGRWPGQLAVRPRVDVKPLLCKTVSGVRHANSAGRCLVTVSCAGIAGWWTCRVWPLFLTEPRLCSGYDFVGGVLRLSPSGVRWLPAAPSTNAQRGKPQ